MMSKWTKNLWTKNSDKDNDPASENIALMEMRSGLSAQPHSSSSLMNSVFKISFFQTETH